MRLILGLFLAWIGASAVVLGWVMMSNDNGTALGLYASLLGPTPFRSNVVPGLIFSLVVGGINIAALFFNFSRYAGRFNWAIAAGLIICAWIVGEVIIIEAVNWLHFMFFGLGLLVILFAWQLKGKWLV